MARIIGFILSLDVNLGLIGAACAGISSVVIDKRAAADDCAFPIKRIVAKIW